jgi:phage tail-like protein
MAVSGRAGGSGAFRSTTTDPIGNYRFLVHFYPQQPDRTTTPWLKPVGMMGFTSVSGLSFNVNVVSIREGGYNTTLHQVPTQVDFSAIQLDRGVLIGSRQNWDWMRMLLRVVQGRGSGNKVLFRSDVHISVLQTPVPYGGGGFRAESSSAEAAYDDKVVMRFRLYNAWPSSVVYSDLNAGDNALMVERMTLVHEGLDVDWGSVTERGLVLSAPNFGNP